MKLFDYDRKIIQTVKALRELRRIKQYVVADALGVDRSTYCRIENGELPVSIGQLKIIAHTINTSAFQIIAIADADNDLDFKLTSLSDILVRFVMLTEERDEKIRFSEEELQLIVGKIKALYSKNLEKNG